MPEYQIPLGEKSKEFSELDSFTQAYVEALFWTEANPDNEELKDATFADLAPETLEKIIQDCIKFQNLAKDFLEHAQEIKSNYTDERAGHDFWLTRNHHGTGFWDRGLDKVGDILTTLAQRYSSLDLYLGDDKKLYLS